jgi:hypothetical protein
MDPVDTGRASLHQNREHPVVLQRMRIVLR